MLSFFFLLEDGKLRAVFACLLFWVFFQQKNFAISSTIKFNEYFKLILNFETLINLLFIIKCCLFRISCFSIYKHGIYK